MEPSLRDDATIYRDTLKNTLNESRLNPRKMWINSRESK